PRRSTTTATPIAVGRSRPRCARFWTLKFLPPFRVIRKSLGLGLAARTIGEIDHDRDRPNEVDQARSAAAWKRTLVISPCEGGIPACGRLQLPGLIVE